MIRINVLAIRLKGSKSVENNKGLFSDSAQDHTEVERILKLGEDESSSMEVKDEASLYDKLVYSLISESLMTHSDNIMTDDCDGGYNLPYGFDDVGEGDRIRSIIAVVVVAFLRDGWFCWKWLLTGLEHVYFVLLWTLLFVAGLFSEVELQE
ncbi:hypothetical protein TNCV_4748791 [Trichonephila clavipes]|nr:hypothetical protein TNCV_4748791 [Trichonephila clavipes]